MEVLLKMPDTVASKYRKIEPLATPESLHAEVKPFKVEFRMVNPRDLYVDSKYQRDLTKKSYNLISRIIRKWDWKKFKPPIVSVDENGVLCVIDGQHTSIGAATNKNISEIPVFVVPMGSQIERAQSFVGHNTERLAVSGISKFRARLEACDDDAVGVDLALRNSGVLLAGLGTSVPEGSCRIASPDALLVVYHRYGLQNLRRTLSICKAAKMEVIDAHFLLGVSECLAYKKFKHPVVDDCVVLCIRDYPLHELKLEVETRHIKAKYHRSTAMQADAYDKNVVDPLTRRVMVRNIILAKYIERFGEPHP